MYETLASVYENQSLHNFVLQILTNYTLMLIVASSIINVPGCR